MRNLFRSFYHRVFRTKTFYISIAAIAAYAAVISGLLLLLAYLAYGGSGAEVVLFPPAAILLSSFYGGLNALIGLESGVNTIFVITLLITFFRLRDDFRSGTVSSWICSGHSRKEVHATLYFGHLSYAAMLMLTFMLVMLGFSAFLPFSPEFGLEEGMLGQYVASFGYGLLWYIAWYSVAFFMATLTQEKAIGPFLGYFVILGLPIVYSIAQAFILGSVDPSHYEQYEEIQTFLHHYVDPWMPDSQFNLISRGILFNPVTEYFDTYSGITYVSYPTCFDETYNCVVFAIENVALIVGGFFFSQLYLRKTKLK